MRSALLGKSFNLRIQLPDDVVAVSPDEGKSWERQDEGSGAQGGYYDAATGVRWRVAGYALSKRTIP